MHERKALMADLADAFVALPGGVGTLEELFEVYTWAQLGIHAKPVGLLDVAGYWEPLAAWLDHAVDAGFLRPSTAPCCCATPSRRRCSTGWRPGRPRPVTKWLDRPER